MFLCLLSVREMRDDETVLKGGIPPVKMIPIYRSFSIAMVSFGSDSPWVTNTVLAKQIFGHWMTGHDTAAVTPTQALANLKLPTFSKGMADAWWRALSLWLICPLLKNMTQFENSHRVIMMHWCYYGSCSFCRQIMLIHRLKIRPYINLLIVYLFPFFIPIDSPW